MQVTVENISSPEEPTTTSPAHSTTPVEHLSIKDRFNIDTPTTDENKKLLAIWDFVKAKNPGKEIGDYIWEVINLEQTIGAPALGETRLDKLHRYVSLRIQEQRIQEQLKDVAHPTQRF